MKWVRTCQECDFKQTDREPEHGKPLSDAYLNRKCKRCKSLALDYGSEVTEGVNTEDSQ